MRDEVFSYWTKAQNGSITWAKENFLFTTFIETCDYNFSSFIMLVAWRWNESEFKINLVFALFSRGLVAVDRLSQSQPKFNDRSGCTFAKIRCCIVACSIFLTLVRHYWRGNVWPNSVKGEMEQRHANIYLDLQNMKWIHKRITYAQMAVIRNQGKEQILMVLYLHWWIWSWGLREKKVWAVSMLPSLFDRREVRSQTSLVHLHRRALWK